MCSAVGDVLDGTVPAVGYVTLVETHLLAGLAHRELTAVVPVRAVPPRCLPPQAPVRGRGSQTMRLGRGRARITAMRSI